MDLSGWHLWVIAGLIAGAMEIKLSGFVMLWFSVGAFIAAAAAGLGLPLTVQVAIFTLASAGLFAASRTIFQKWFMQSKHEMPIGLDAMLGAEATVVDALPSDGQGTVRINGELWSARSTDGAIAPGALVRVDSVDGLKLKVRRLETAPVVVTQGEKTS